MSIQNTLLRRGFQQQVRSLATSARLQSRWTAGPAPPKLPKEDQEIFEQLQQQSTGAFSTPREPEPVSSATDAAQNDSAVSTQSSTERMLEMLKEKARVKADGSGEELHPNIRRGAAPEFTGDTNPNTGEVGGPKNEPLRWGHGGDWSYNGRVSDF